MRGLRLLSLCVLLSAPAYADAPAPSRHKKAIHTPLKQPGRKGIIIAPGGSGSGGGGGGGLTPIGSPGSCTSCNLSINAFGQVTHYATGGGGAASTTSYTPTVGGDWSPSPANVSDALDQLAADIAADGGGTVTSIVAGAGLSGGTVTHTGTFSLPDTGPGATTSCGSTSYANSIQTDAKGRVVAINCGTPTSGGISGLTSGTMPIATSGTAVGDSKFVLATGGGDYINVKYNGGTGGNGSINIQPTTAAGNYGAELSLDNTVAEVGDNAWSIIVFNANSVFDKGFGIMSSVTTHLVILPNGHTLINNNGTGDYGHFLSVTGDIEAHGAGNGFIFGDGTSQTTAASPPTIATNQIAYATGTNTIGGSSQLTYNGTNLTLSGVDADGSLNGPLRVVSPSGGSVGAAITVDNTAQTSGRKWSILSGGTSTPDNGSFYIADNSAPAYRFEIDPSGQVNFRTSTMQLHTDATFHNFAGAYALAGSGFLTFDGSVGTTLGYGGTTLTVDTSNVTVATGGFKIGSVAIDPSSPATDMVLQYESGKFVARAMVYTPAVGSNWNGTPPVTITEALDRIAAMAAGGTLAKP